MKKLMMMAMMVVASATAFAGYSDAFKAFKKSFKGLGYAEAEALVKSSIDQFANAQEKAAAYNMLVDLAYDAFNKQSTIETENQLAKQMGQQEKPIDKELMAESAYNAICNATLSPATSSTSSPTRRARWPRSSLRRTPSASGWDPATPSSMPEKKLLMLKKMKKYASIGSFSLRATSSLFSKIVNVRARKFSLVR